MVSNMRKNYYVFIITLKQIYAAVACVPTATNSVLVFSRIYIHYFKEYLVKMRKVFVDSYKCRYQTRISFFEQA